MAVLVVQEKRFQTLVLMVHLVSSLEAAAVVVTVVAAQEVQAEAAQVAAPQVMVRQERLIQAVAEVVLILDHRALEGVV